MVLNYILVGCPWLEPCSLDLKSSALLGHKAPTECIIIKTSPSSSGEGGGGHCDTEQHVFSRSHIKRSIFCGNKNFLFENSNSMTLQFEKLINNLYAKRTISENEVAKPAFFVVITW